MGTIFAQPDRSNMYTGSTTSPTIQSPTSDPNRQPTRQPSATPRTSSISSTPPASPLPYASAAIHTSSQRLQFASQPHIAKPQVFDVPRNVRQILDLSPDSTSPESIVKQALLSDEPSKNAIALVGMGGAGKTTILRALGRDGDIMAKFSDGIWFFELGHDVKLSSLLRQMQTLVKFVFPDFLGTFKELAADEDTHRTMITQLMERLATERFLLLFDDVWDVNASVYKLLFSMCTAVQGSDSTSLKILTSTRSGDIGDVPTHDVCIAVNPEDCDAEKSVGIFCCYARINPSKLPSLSPENRLALRHILETCAGLPLALSVAGSAVKQLMAPSTDMSNQNAFVEYWHSLESNTTQLSNAESGERHQGLFVALQSSLQALEKRWKLENITMEDMFRSLCILQKQMCLPLSAIDKLWGVATEVTQDGVHMLARNSLVSLVWDNRKVVGVRIHDLVHDLSVKMAMKQDGVSVWHARLLDAYKSSVNSSTGNSRGNQPSRSTGVGSVDAWWNLDKNDKYMNDNVVRHLLGAGRISEALHLLTDYRWVERMNEDKERPPFQKVITELQLSRAYLKKYEKTDIGRRLMYDIDIVTRTMGLCMTLHCMKNRDECTFQLYGRLCGVTSECGLVERIVWSIEQHGQKPWARAGRSVLTSGGSLLKRVLEAKCRVWCMSAGAAGDDVVVGGDGGKLLVLNGRDGSIRRPLTSQDDECKIADVFVDRSSGLIYSCSEQGCVTVWKNHKQLRCMQAQGLRGKELITCMKILPSMETVFLGTDRGLLLKLDMRSGNTTKTVYAHNRRVSSMTFVQTKNVLVSASDDRMIRFWSVENLEYEDCMEVHRGWVNSVTLSNDGRLLASGSNDDTVRIWDAQSCAELWKSSQHNSSVTCVLFSEDGNFLYSGDEIGTICVWRVKDGGRDVSLVHTLRHGTMHSVVSLSIGDDSELFALSLDRVYVWDARDFSNTSSCQEIEVFLPDVKQFGVSADGATMVTWSPQLDQIEIRNVSDVSKSVDRVISSFKIPDYHFGIKLAVSDDQRLVAYSTEEYRKHECLVFIVDARDGTVLHSLSTVKRWNMSSIEEQQGLSASSSRLLDAPGGPRTSYNCRYNHPDKGLESLSFNSDASVVHAIAVAEGTGTNWRRVRKLFSWDVMSGNPVSGDESSAIKKKSEPKKTIRPHLFFKGSLATQSFYFSKNITCIHNGKTFTIASLEHYVKCAHYCFNSSRLWISRDSGGLEYVDLITESTKFIPREEPQLPVLSQLDTSQMKEAAKGARTSIEAEDVYDVFISHAGPDKITIAEPLYELLVGMGLKVFLDKAELRPGQSASRKMIYAMQTARIAVLILSPEFAARKWTLKELMCFLERFRGDGERGVTIIPVFYRLSLNDCRDQHTLFNLKDDKGQNVFVAEGFLERMADEDEYGIGDVLKALQTLRSVTGIENKDGVTNGTSAEERAKRKRFVEAIAIAIEEANQRLESNRGACPSGAYV